MTEEIKPEIPAEEPQKVELHIPERPEDFSSSPEEAAQQIMMIMSMTVSKLAEQTNLVPVLFLYDPDRKVVGGQTLEMSQEEVDEAFMRIHTYLDQRRRAVPGTDTKQ